MNEKIVKAQEKISLYLPEGKDIEYSKLPPIMADMLKNYSTKQFYDVVEDSLVMDLMVFFSILACSRRVEIISPLGYPSTFPNFYLIRLMPSSYGKDSPFDTLVFDLASGIKEELEKQYEIFLNDVKERPYLRLPRLKTALFNMCQKSDDESLKDAYDSLRRDDPLKKIPEAHNFSFEMTNATLQGFSLYSEWLHLFGKGCAFLKMSEFGSYITGNDENKKDFLTGLNSAWENKPVEIKKLKGERRSLVDKVKIPTVVMGNSSSFWVKEEEDKAKLYMFLNMGYGRRFFVFQPKDVVSKQKSDMDFEKEMERMEESVWLEDVKIDLREKVEALYKGAKTMLLWEEDARKTLYAYKIFNGTKADEFVVQGEDQHPLASELKGRAEVCIKLCGIFAFMCGSDRIKKEHVGYAIYFIERYKNQTLQFLLEQYNIKTTTQRLFEFIKEEPRNRQKIKERNIIPQNSFHYVFDKELEELKEYCNDNGYILKESTGRYNSRIFSIETPKEIDENEIPIMVADEGSLEQMSKNTNYRKIFTTWEELHRVVKRYAYMPQLNNGRRSKKDAVEGGVLLGLDVDDKWTLEQAKDYFEQKGIKCLIITTKSHQSKVDKRGNAIKPRDKFRIIILLKNPYIGSADSWSRMVANFSKDFPKDEACKDISRFFYPSPSDAIYYYIDGEPLDWREYDYSPPQPRTATSKTLDTDYWERKALEKLNQEYNIGNRDNTLRDTVYMLQTNGVDSDRAYEIVKGYYDTHPTSGDPIDMEKFRKEINY